MTDYQRAILRRLSTLDLTGTLKGMMAEHAELCAAATAVQPGEAVTAEQGRRFYDAIAAIVYGK